MTMATNVPKATIVVQKGYAKESLLHVCLTVRLATATTAAIQRGVASLQEFAGATWQGVAIDTVPQIRIIHANIVTYIETQTAGPTFPMVNLATIATRVLVPTAVV